MLEKFLWGVYDYAEIYTFLLVWVVIPLGFVTFFVYVRRMGTPVIQSEVPKVPVAASETERRLEKAQIISEDSKANLNEANA